MTDLTINSPFLKLEIGYKGFHSLPYLIFETNQTSDIGRQCPITYIIIPYKQNQFISFEDSTIKTVVKMISYTSVEGDRIQDILSRHPITIALSKFKLRVYQEAYSATSLWTHGKASIIINKLRSQMPTQTFMNSYLELIPFINTYCSPNHIIKRFTIDGY